MIRSTDPSYLLQFPTSTNFWLYLAFQVHFPLVLLFLAILALMPLGYIIKRVRRNWQGRLPLS